LPLAFPATHHQLMQPAQKKGAMDEKVRDVTKSPHKGRRYKLKSDLRKLEIEAYCAVISAFRAQGELTWKKEKTLHELRHLLKIADERHKMEMQRVCQDENLAEIAQLNNNLLTFDDEGVADSDEQMKGNEKTRAAKKQKSAHSWGPIQTALPHLDAVPLPSSSHPPNLNQLSPIKKDQIHENQKHTKTTTEKANGKRAKAASRVEPPKGEKAQIPSEGESIEAEGEGELELDEENEEEESEMHEDREEGFEKDDMDMGTDEGLLPGATLRTKDQTALLNMEASLKAKQEQLRAELERLQAEIDSEDDSPT